LIKKIILFVVITLYSYASSLNNQMLKKIQFENSNSSNFSFAVMGDNRDGDYVLNKIIKSINKDKDVKFALNNGDLVPDGYNKEFKNYLKLIKTSDKPFISIIGNHEKPWYSGKTNYEHFFGKTYFSFRFGNSYFIILDDSNEKGLSKKQKKWLINELKKAQSFQNRFIFMHVPLYDPRKGHYQKGHSLDNTTKAKELNDIFDKYKVTMLFTSHIHIYDRGVWQQTPFLITGGAGAPLKKYKDNGFYHYIKVVVHDKDIHYKVIKIDAKPLGLIDEVKQSIKDALDLY